MIDISPELADEIRRQLRRQDIPGDILRECRIWMDLCPGRPLDYRDVRMIIRSLDYMPVPRVKQETQIVWRSLEYGTPVCVDSPEEGKFGGWFMGVMRGGLILVRPVLNPEIVEIYGKYIRLAMPADNVPDFNPDYLEGEVEYDDDEETKLRKQPPVKLDDDGEMDDDYGDEDDEPEFDEGLRSRPWTEDDCGADVLAVVNGVETMGKLTKVYGNGLVQVTYEEGRDTDTIDVPVDDVFEVIRQKVTPEVEEEIEEEVAAS